MENPMPRNDMNHDTNIPMKEYPLDDGRADEKELLQMEEVDKGRLEGGPMLGRLGFAAVLLFTVVVTQGLAWYSKHTSHFRPFTTGQIGVLLVFVFCISLFCAIHIAALVFAATSHNFAQAYRHHKLRLITEDNLKYLTAAAEFAVLMLYFYVCDRTDLFTRADKHFDRDQYWFISLAVLAAGLGSVRKVHNLPTSGHILPLQRDQTEEWKGWMQIQFLMYHYFHATDYYNAIRCYIAAYVWMTGFGNFSFYYVKRDFGLQRFFGMQWRLNFFVFWCCLLLENDYMLYYICMLHTTFTVFIYGTLGLMSDMNYTLKGITLKFVLLTTLVGAIWNIPGVFDVLWAPLRFLVDYQGSLHEWAFRSKLDHLVWIPGMLTAFFHPNCDTFLERLDTKPYIVQYSIKAVIVIICLIIGNHWCQAVFFLPKKEYNNLHPFTSFIPITVYIFLRNISSRLRRYHMAFFAWMGKITLETYICQFHIWMLTTGPNGNPKKLLQLLPNGWPMVNFAVVTAIYVFVAYRIFHITNTLKNLAIPSGKEGLAKLKQNLITWPLIGISIYSFSFFMKLVA